MYDTCYVPTDSDLYIHCCMSFAGQALELHANRNSIPTGILHAIAGDIQSQGHQPELLLVNEATSPNSSILRAGYGTVLLLIST